MHPEQDKQLPEGWTECKSDDNRVFYRSEVTGESVRTKPILPAEYVWVGQPREVECYHLMVKHVGVRIPSSWRQPVITRSKEEAVQLIKKYRMLIVSKRRTFQDLARRFSDCPSAKYNGHLGVFRRGEVRQRFAELVFSLTVGQMLTAMLMSKKRPSASQALM